MTKAENFLNSKCIALFCFYLNLWECPLKFYLDFYLVLCIHRSVRKFAYTHTNFIVYSLYFWENIKFGFHNVLLFLFFSSFFFFNSHFWKSCFMLSYLEFLFYIKSYKSPPFHNHHHKWEKFSTFKFYNSSAKYSSIYNIYAL